MPSTRVLALLMLGAYGIWYLRLLLKAPTLYGFVGLFGIASFFLSFWTRQVWFSVVGLGAAIVSRVLYQKQGSALRREPGRRPEPEERQQARYAARMGPAPTRWVEFTTEIAAAALATDEGRLALGAGTFRAELQIEHREHQRDDGETYSELAISLRFGDSSGREWSVTSVLAPSAFSDGFGDAARREAIEARDGFMGELSRDLARAWEDHCLIRDVTTFLDSRERFWLRFGAQRRRLHLAQEEPRIDVALAEPDRLLVCVTGLTRLAHPAHEDGEPLAEHDLVPHELERFCWLERGALLLCFAEPSYHYATFAELLAAPELSERREPRATATGRRVEPQPRVLAG